MEMFNPKGVKTGSKKARTFLATMLILTTVSVLLVDPTFRFTFAGHSGNRDRASFNDWSNGTIEKWAESELISDDGPVELIIGIRDEPNSYEELTELLTKHDAEIINPISMHGQVTATVVTTPSKMGASSLVNEIKTTGLSRYIEPNARVKVIQFEPNDPAWQPNHTYHQWGPKMIKVNWAWNATLGDRSINVTVIDTGIDYSHEDLNANYVSGGRDWVNNDGDPMDDFGHGTWVSGIIAAEINNSKGIAGLAQVSIMMEKVGDDEGVAKTADIAGAIIHATDQGAKIISMSFGHYYRSDAVYDAVKYAYDAGVLLVAAAGNEGWSARLYPAAFDEVIAVTATNENDGRWVDSNYGNWVELAAPGAGISSTHWKPGENNSYLRASGTSAAAPHVAGVAALIWSQNRSLTRDQVRIRLRKTAKDTGAPGFDKFFGYGRIDGNASVSQPPPNHDVLILDWKRPPYAEVGKPATIKPTILNYGTSHESNITVRLLANSTVVDNATISSLASGAKATVYLSWSPTVEGVYNITSHVAPVPNETVEDDNVVWVYVTTEVGVLRVDPNDPKYYPTIQDAVDAAYEGDTIKVASGTYNEVINIYKHGLKFIGESKTNTTISGGNIGGWGFIAYAWDNIHISGFTIKWYPERGIDLRRCFDLSISPRFQYCGFLNAKRGMRFATSLRICFIISGVNRMPFARQKL